MSAGSGQSPDLSRIVSLIMQNPDLIRQIEALASKDKENTEAEVASSENAEPTERVAAEVSIPAAAMPQRADKREKRTQLLSALRPYVSEKRGKTIDTLLGAMDLWDLVGRG